VTGVLNGDVRDVLPTLDAGSVQCVVTSPPYWGLRDYGVAGQIGLEPTPEGYVETLVDVFQEVRRVLRDDGTLWLNLGDSYSPDHAQKRLTLPEGQANYGIHAHTTGSRARDQRGPPPGLKPKDLVGIPWRVAFALQADGWYLRSDIIWAKGLSFCDSYSGSVMPESVTDRPTKGHEYLFLLTKNARYYYDADAVREGGTRTETVRAHAPTKDMAKTPLNVERAGWRNDTSGRNLRSVWTINPQPFSEAHFATFPTALVEPCVKAGTKKGDTVLDPFAGSGTVGCVALKLGRTFLGVELNPDYCAMANASIDGPLFA